MVLEWVQSVLDFLIGLSWPVVVGFAIWLFKDQIRGLIDNIWRLRGPGGTLIETHPRGRQDEDITETIPDDVAGYEELLRNIENQYQLETDQVRQDYEELRRRAEQLQLRLAQTEAALYYERVSSDIRDSDSAAHRAQSAARRVFD